MSFLDKIVNGSFRDTPSGRVVVFSGDPRKRGYLVRSAADEGKIRSFLKMFFFAHLYILVVGILVAQGTAAWFAYGVFDRPAHHLLGSLAICLGIYLLIAGVPYALLWRAYRRALTSFTAPADEILLTGTEASGRRWVVPALIGFALVILAAIMLLALRPS